MGADGESVCFQGQSRPRSGKAECRLLTQSRARSAFDTICVPFFDSPLGRKLLGFNIRKDVF
jgi:hypothetical protein